MKESTTLKMNRTVCFISPYIYGYFNSDLGFTGGGAERQLYLLSTALADQFDIHVIVGDYGQPKTEVREGVTLHRAYPLHSRQNQLQPFKHFLILAQAMHQADADVYVDRNSPRNAAFTYLITKVLRRKWVYNIANDANIQDRPSQLPSPVQWLFRRAIYHADDIIAQTDKQQSLVKRTYGVESKVVPNGYPTASVQPEFSDRDYLLWVGTLTEDQKRPHLYLDIAERFPQYPFRLIGPCNAEVEYQNRIIKRAEELQNVEFLGEVPPDEIHQHYKHALALVNTSAYEGFPNTFLEAWRFGTPVVSLNVDPSRFVSQPFVDFASGNIEILDNYMIKLISNPKLWRAASSIIISRFESNYSISKVTMRYGSVLSNV